MAIPLHRGRRWAENVLGNIARLRGHARILVSDAHEHDDALRTIRERADPGDDLILVGRRDLPPGWVPHYNDLLNRVRTPLMMWLPQDDEIGAEWVVDCATTLRRVPGAILATGTLRAIEEDGCERAGLTIVPCPRLASSDKRERVATAVTYMDRDWAPIGLPFRGVFRRDRAIAVPESTTDGEWADLLWALGMLTRGSFAAVPGAVYGKRFYDSSEHRWWSSFARSPDAITLIDDVFQASAGQAARMPLLMAAWHGDRSALIDLLAHAESLLAGAERRAAEAADRTAAAEREAALRAQSEARLRDADAALAAVLGSRSWRLTAPVRRLAALLRTRRRP